ncbi:MAG TPA: hypothetical protein VK465_06500 [Fibrobacteria bacterium]|nr:hypothetical protein [Fibrobacteria bacterium]
MPLADLLAAEKAGQDTHVPPKTQTQGQPNRVGFSDVAPVRLIPKGEDFNPGEFHPGWPHQLSEGPKPKVVKPNASNAKFKPVLRISLPESTVSMDGRPGREAPYPLNNKSYPTPSPKGILKKAGPGTGSPDSTPPASPSTPSAPLIPSTAQETETKEAGTKKELLGNVAALGAALTVTAVVAPGLISAAKEEDSSSSGQSEA